MYICPIKPINKLGHMETTTSTSTRAFELQVEKVKQSGKTTITVRDGDDHSWQSGFADWLMSNYNYQNKSFGFTAFLNSKKA